MDIIHNIIFILKILNFKIQQKPSNYSIRVVLRVIFVFERMGKEGRTTSDR